MPQSRHFEKIEAIKEEKRLKHVGVTLDVDCITDSREMKIKILEGNLRASLARIENTEKRSGSTWRP